MLNRLRGSLFWTSGIKVAADGFDASRAAADIADGRTCDAEPLGDRLHHPTLRAELPDFRHLTVGQPANRPPAFPHGIADVVLRRADREVSRIHTARVVAAVHDDETVRNRPLRQLVGEPMRQNNALRDARLKIDLDVAVTRERVALNDPACRRFDGAGGEALGGCILAILTAVQPYCRLSPPPHGTRFRLGLRFRIRQGSSTSLIRSTRFPEPFRDQAGFSGRRIFRTRIGHATHNTVSSGTPVRSLMRTAFFTRGRMVPDSAREYPAWDMPSFRAASRWLSP